MPPLLGCRNKLLPAERHIRRALRAKCYRTGRPARHAVVMHNRRSNRMTDLGQQTADVCKQLGTLADVQRHLDNAAAVIWDVIA